MPIVTITPEQQKGLYPFGPLPYAEFYVRSGDIETFGIDWSGWLANDWQAGAQIATSAVIRPTLAMGYQAMCTTAGQSGTQEPKWPGTVGATVLDGSVLWTMEAIDATSLATTVSSAAWQPPTGITVSGAVVSGQIVSATVSFSGVTAGTDYVVNIPTTFANGQVRAGQLKFKVR